MGRLLVADGVQWQCSGVRDWPMVCRAVGNPQRRCNKGIGQSGPTGWRMSVVGLRGKILVAGGCRGGCCEKLQEASPMSDRASAAGSECQCQDKRHRTQTETQELVAND